MTYTISQPKKLKAPDDQGMIHEVVQSLKAIPHLPAALTDGVDDPRASDQEKELRRRALAEAQQWVLPLIITGAIGAIPATGGASVLIGAVADAAGFGIGSGLAAQTMGEEDPLKTGLMNAAFGGVIGGGLGAAKLGGKIFEEQAATRAAGLASDAAAKSAAEEAAQQAQARAADLTRRQGTGPQLDLFDYGLTGQERQTVAGELPLNAQTNQGAQGNLFQDSADMPSSLPTTEIYKKVYAGPVGFATRTADAPVGLAAVAGARADGELPSQAMSRLETTGRVDPPAPKSFDSPKAAPPQTPPTDELLALHDVTPTIAQERAAGAGRKAVLGAASVPMAYAPDQVLGDAFNEGAQAILRGDLHGLGRAAAKGKQAIRLSDTWRQAGEILSRAAEPARKTLQRMGPAGTELAAALDKVLVEWRNGAGEHMAEIQQALQGMTKEDRIHIGEVLEGLATPKTITHANRADKLREILGWYADAAEELGIRQYMEDGEVRKFTRMGNYMPRYIDQKALQKLLQTNSPEFKAAYEKMRLSGQAKSVEEARALVRKWALTPPEFRTSSLNFVRGDLNLPYEKDPLKALSKYVYSVRKRIETARVFGADDKGVLPYYERIHHDGGNWKVAQRIYSAFSDQLPLEYSKAIKAVSTYNSWTMLTTSGLVQPAQQLNTAAITSYASTFKALGAYFADKAHAEYLATKAGVHINEVLQDIMGAGLADDPTAFFLKNVTFLEPLDKANRVIAALAGRFEVDRLAPLLKEGKKGVGEALERIGVSPAELIANDHVPTEKMYRDAAYTASVKSQHGSTVMDLPEARNSPMGHILFQFKTFALQQANFIDKDVLRPAKAYLTTGGKRGSLGPLARYSAGLGPTGAVFGELVRGIKGQVAADDPKIKMMENMALAGGFGIYYDMISAMANGKDRFLSFLAGPGVSEAAAYAGDVGAATFKGNPEQLAKHLLKRVPIVGQPLSNYWFFPPQ